MDQGNSSSQQEDSNFYDAYGTGMDDDANDAAFQIGAWDHQGHGVPAVYPHVVGGQTEFDPATMDEFVTTHYGQEFQHTQSFEQDGQQFQGFMGETIRDQQSGNEPFDMNSMDLYHAPTIYPNLAQETMQFGTRSRVLYSDNDLEQVTPSSVNPPHNINANPAALDSTMFSIRPSFKFTAEQKQIMMDRFEAGLHYPTNAEKDSIAQMFGVASESVSSHISQLT
jgi:hypothetical protein